MEATNAPQAAYGPAAEFSNVLRSEFTKLRSVRSTYWTLLVALVLTIGLAAITAVVVPGHLHLDDRATFNGARLSLGGVNLAQIAIGVLGVLVITSEYGTGMIRATLSAVPQRKMLLAAKGVVFAVTALIVGLVASFAAFFLSQAILAGQHPAAFAGAHLQSSISDPGVLRAVGEPGCTWPRSACSDSASGRSSAPAPGRSRRCSACSSSADHLAPCRPSWQDTIDPYLPFNAGRRSSRCPRQRVARLLEPDTASSASTRRSPWRSGPW